MKKPCPSCGAQIWMLKLSTSQFDCLNCGTPIKPNKATVYCLNISLAILIVFAIHMVSKIIFNFDFLTGDTIGLIIMKGLMYAGIFFLVSKFPAFWKGDRDNSENPTSQRKTPEKGGD